MIKVVTFWEPEKETKEMYPVNSTQFSILCDMTIWLSQTINCFFFFCSIIFFKQQIYILYPGTWV